MLTISNLVPSGSISTQFNISSSGFVNPISTAPFSGYVITTTDATGAYIEQASVSFSVPNPYNITGNLNLGLSGTNVVSELAGL